MTDGQQPNNRNHQDTIATHTDPREAQLDPDGTITGHPKPETSKPKGKGPQRRKSSRECKSRYRVSSKKEASKNISTRNFTYGSIRSADNASPEATIKSRLHDVLRSTNTTTRLTIDTLWKMDVKLLWSPSEGRDRDWRRQLLQDINIEDQTKLGTVYVQVTEVKQSTNLVGTTTSKTTILLEKHLKRNPAALLILGVGMRDDSEDFAELIGLAPPNVIESLADFARPPLIKLQHLPILMQGAARAMTAPKDDRIGNINPVELTIRIADVIAALLGYIDVTGNDNQRLEELITKTVYYGYRNLNDLDQDQRRNDWDTGCRVGLFIASLQLCVLREDSKLEKRQKLVDTIIGVTSGLLSGVPVAGFAIAAAGPIVEVLARKIISKRAGKQRKIMAHIRTYFYSMIEHQIFRDNKLLLYINGPAEAPIQVNIIHEDFERWYKKMLEWTGMDV